MIWECVAVGGGTQRGKAKFNKVDVQKSTFFHVCWSTTLHSQLPYFAKQGWKMCCNAKLICFNCLSGHSSQLSDKYWHHLSCIRLLHFVASYFKIPQESQEKAVKPVPFMLKCATICKAAHLTCRPRLLAPGKVTFSCVYNEKHYIIKSVAQNNVTRQQ